jgi:hypothetical protein
MLDIQGAILSHFHESMKGTIARYRRHLVVSIVFLLVGVVTLSTASRQPCLRACSGPWHTYKAGHMSEPEQDEVSAADAVESTEVVLAETKALPPRYVPHEEALPIALPLTVQEHHFRSPPFLQ